jgi:hypothetical protein
MTWNDELSRHLELINARLTHLETTPMLANESDYLGPTEYPREGVPSASSVALRISAPVHLQNI